MDNVIKLFQDSRIHLGPASAKHKPAPNNVKRIIEHLREFQSVRAKLQRNISVINNKNIKMATLVY